MTAVSSKMSCGLRVDDYTCHQTHQHLNTVRMSTSNYGRTGCGVCSSQIDLKVCNRCKAVWYCSVQHQKQHYKEHKEFCKNRARGSATIESGGVNGVGGGQGTVLGPLSENKKKKRRHQQQTNFTFEGSVLDEVMNVPLVSDFQIPLQGTGVGSVRRRSLADRDLTTPIDSDSGSSLEASSTQPLQRSLVQVCPDSKTLEEGGFSPEWFTGVMQPLMNDLNRYGVCVVDNFLGRERADQILTEVEDLHDRGVFRDGQVVSRSVHDQARGIIRGDKITWVTGGEPDCGGIGQLVSVVDTLIAKANKHQDAGELAKYTISWRTRAMVACYPGKGTHYVKHVDNPDGDGRCITAIYYINKDWRPEDGGVLRVYPEGSNQVAEIKPLFDRMLFFWSDRRNPHEVLPATVTSRYAVTLWYLDQKEREEYLSRVSGSMVNT